MMWCANVELALLAETDLVGFFPQVKKTLEANRFHLTGDQCKGRILAVGEQKGEQMFFCFKRSL